MVKDDKHRTRGLVTKDKEIDLTKNLHLLRFITAIQDEAHRFAITYNKQLRSKRYEKSVLDEINGIGAKRKKALIKHFGSVNKIKAAEEEQLMEVEGITKSIAEKIHKHFNELRSKNKCQYSQYQTFTWLLAYINLWMCLVADGTDYMEKLKNEWFVNVMGNDTVIIPGDISWATYLEQAYEDFIFIDSLPGMKIISKGNHDYWWTTLKKLEKYVDDNNLTTISFMHNGSYKVENVFICGTRGWKCPGEDSFTSEDNKIYLREIQRLELSLKDTKNSDAEEIITALHYPPFNPKGEKSDFIEIMKLYKVKTCIYGHLHGDSNKNAIEGYYEGINFICVSADKLNFIPFKLK